MSATTLDPRTAARLRRRRLIISVVVASLIIHFMGAIGAGIWVVARYFLPPAATFEVKKEIRIAAEEREHRMNMAEFDSGRPKPSFTDKMSTARPTEFSLPELPLIPVEAVATLDPSDIVSDQLAGLGGMGGGSGTGSGGGGRGGSAVNFFGISDMATRVIIVVDVSDSMFDRQPGKFNAVKQEAEKLIKGLGVNTLFNLIIYEGGSVAMFPEVRPATDSNKTSAAEWIQSVDGGMNKRSMSYFGTYSKMGTGLYEGGGTRLDTAMKQALSMRPSTIFLITDGEINRSSRGREPDPPPGDDDKDGKGGKGGGHQFTGTKISKQDILGIIKNAQKSLEEPAKIHVIHFLTKLAKKDEEDILRSIARGNDGRFKAVKAEDY